MVIVVTVDAMIGHGGPGLCLLAVTIPTDIDARHQNFCGRDAGVDRSRFLTVCGQNRIKLVSIDFFFLLAVPSVAQRAFDRRMSIVSKAIVTHPSLRQVGRSDFPFDFGVVGSFCEMTFRAGGFQQPRRPGTFLNLLR